MKTWIGMMLLTSTLIAPLAYSQDDIDEIMAREITEGKILAAENMMIEDLHKEIASRQEKASQLIALVARFANDRMSDENAKEEALRLHCPTAKYPRRPGSTKQERNSTGS